MLFFSFVGCTQVVLALLLLVADLVTAIPAPQNGQLPKSSSLPVSSALKQGSKALRKTAGQNLLDGVKNVYQMPKAGVKGMMQSGRNVKEHIKNGNYGRAGLSAVGTVARPIAGLVAAPLAPIAGAVSAIAPAASAGFARLDASDERRYEGEGTPSPNGKGELNNLKKGAKSMRFSGSSIKKVLSGGRSS